MKWIPWRKNRPGLVGVEITERGIAFAHVEHSRLAACELLVSTENGLPSEQFVEKIESLGLQGCTCNLVLPVGSYQLLLVEAPNVPDNELREAVRFRIKDMLSFPLDEALVDVFALPADSSRSGRKMLYVVAAQESKVSESIALIQQAGLTLESIDITEMALRNLGEGFGEDSAGLAMVRLQQNSGMLTLMKGEQMYLSRQFQLDYNAGLFDELPEEQLALELQRSLDYYERQMGQVPPRQVLLCGENVSDDKITDSLTNAVSTPLKFAELDKTIENDSHFDDSLLQACVVAIGGALRRQQAA